jgi:hypothetical protein
MNGAEFAPDLGRITGKRVGVDTATRMLGRDDTD